MKTVLLIFADHPYITSRHSTDNNLVDPDLSDYQDRPPETTQLLSPVEESLHLHLSLSDDELSQSGDTSCDSFVTCDGEVSYSAVDWHLQKTLI